MTTAALPESVGTSHSVNLEGMPAERRPFEDVPNELKAQDQWVMWKSEPDPRYPEKLRKVPYNARTGGRASTTKPKTWTSFDTALAALQDEYAGLGIVLAEDDPFIFIDLDHCRDAGTGVVAQWAADIVAQFPNWYWELSPSGTGLHGLGKGTWATQGNNGGMSKFMQPSAMRP